MLYVFIKKYFLKNALFYNFGCELDCRHAKESQNELFVTSMF